MKTDNLKYMSGPTYRELKTANVYWQPNRYCNYECSYCWPSSHTKVKDFVDKDLAFITIDKCVEKFKKRDIQRINWGWSGGESTFHPHFLDFQERILSHKSDELIMMLNVTTNLSHNMPWWKKFVNTTKKYKRVSIAASLHQEFVNTPDKVDKFIEKLDYLRGEGVNITINQVMDPDIFDQQLEQLEKFYEKDYPINAKINSLLHKEYLRYTGSTVYTDEQIASMHEQQIRRHEIGYKRYPEVIAIDENNSRLNFQTLEQIKTEGLWELNDWICAAGYLSIAIEGNVVKRGVGGCHRQIIGKLDEDWDLHDEPQLCNANHFCTCTADLKMPKWNPKYDLASEWQNTKIPGI